MTIFHIFDKININKEMRGVKMNNYVIITDSTSDLNKELIDKINVEILPLRYIVGDDQY